MSVYDICWVVEWSGSFFLKNKHKTNKVVIKLNKKEYWFMMGYFVGDGWIEETTKKDGRCMHKIRFAINNKDEKEVYDIINDIIPITDKHCDY